MIKNNLRSFAAHLLFTLIIGIIYIKTRNISVESSTAKFWIHLGLFVLSVTLYILSGFFIMEPQGRKLKNFLSLSVPFAVGLIVYFFDMFVISYLDIYYKGVLYLVYNILFTPVIEVISTFMNYRYVWVILSVFPTLLMWAGLQLKVRRENKIRDENT